MEAGPGLSINGALQQRELKNTTKTPGHKVKSENEPPDPILDWLDIEMYQQSKPSSRQLKTGTKLRIEHRVHQFYSLYLHNQLFLYDHTKAKSGFETKSIVNDWHDHFCTDA